MQGFPRNLGDLAVSLERHHGARGSRDPAQACGRQLVAARGSERKTSARVRAGEPAAKPVRKAGEESESPTTCDEGEPTRRDPSEG